MFEVFPITIPRSQGANWTRHKTALWPAMSRPRTYLSLGESKAVASSALFNEEAMHIEPIAIWYPPLSHY